MMSLPAVVAVQRAGVASGGVRATRFCVKKMFSGMTPRLPAGVCHTGWVIKCSARYRH